MDNETTEQNAFPVQGDVSSRTDTKALMKLPVPLLAVAAYLAMGFLRGLWHPGWLIFLAIPVYYQLVSMAAATGMRKKLNRFPIAVLCVAAYLLLGFFCGLWHPGWMIFLLIPLYHCLVGAIFRK